MRKRIASFLLCICLLFSAALPTMAAETEEQKSLYFAISDREDFLYFTEKCRLDSFSENLLVILKNDIDLTGTGFDGIPVFSGTFEGNGHTIKGMNITTNGSAQGLFRYLTDTAIVQNLKVEGSIQPGGTRSEVGGIAGSHAGKLINCSFSGTVSGNEYIGGLVGVCEVSGVIENCRMNGSVYGSHFVGGIAGKNSGVIRSCENEAQINDTAQQNNVELSDITLDALTNSESINTVTDIGGIAGSSTGMIRECVNRGNVGYRHMGYNIGGIAGTQSGAILDCENYGEIQGRKEVGGIVGQMEPTALIEYEEDALQILQRQLSSMGSVLNDTFSNVQGTTEAIVGQVGILQDHVTNAKDAVESLIPDEENPELPDMDTIQAAQNNISSSISGMTQTLEGMRATAQNAMGTVSTNLYALQEQINAMRTTLGNASETLGGSITDVSDLDTELDLSGKVANSTNYGVILADLNAGGIAGAMAMENDLDHEEDWTLSGENSLNFESELRAVILDCENRATVTVKKQNAGGIVGWQSMGLVKDCLNSGTLDAASADYVGGISGQSMGFIRDSSAKCALSGASYVGGIAGSATIATNCRSMVKLEQGTEKLGAILGFAEESRTAEETPISGNFYLSVSRDIGGIDGISYAGLAEAMQRPEFLALENLPEMFRSVTLRFRFQNGVERSFTVDLGDKFPMEWIPPIPPKNGHTVSWKGATEQALSEIYFDMTFEPEYVGQNTVLQSENTRGSLPILLIQGSFAENAKLTLSEWDVSIPTENGEALRSAWRFEVTEAETVTAARLLLPEDSDGEQVRLLICGSDNTWRQAEHTTDGRYLVIPLEHGDYGVALVQTESDPWLLLAGIGAVLIVGIACLVWFRRKRSKHKTDP